MMYAEILVGKYKGKIAKVSVGDLNEGTLTYPKENVRVLSEQDLADSLINKMLEASMDSFAIQDEMARYVNPNDASFLISQHLGSHHIPNVKGGCCG